MAKDTIQLVHFYFYKKGENGLRHYLLPKDAFAALTEGKTVLLGGIDTNGRDIVAPGGEFLVVRKIDQNPNTSFYEVTIDHPWWTMAICQAADICPMGTGWKQPYDLQLRRSVGEYIIA
ncbi:MAG: hypothetical protein Q4F60_03460 [Candidatus Saccharibacteria bacterium]|nr:hypothetical protein [Candidatus Saccharibacteria bacterium]